MTICIAAICENNKKIVVASDRMITASHLSQEFEHGIPKMEKISNSCLAVTAGSALAPREVFYEVRKWASGVSNSPIQEIVKKVKESFNKLRINKAEEIHIKSRGFKNIKEFYNKCQDLPPQITIPIDQKVSEAELGVEILITGVDSEGAHVHLITDPGKSDCFDSMCYSAVGSGEPHALHTFIAEDYNSTLSLNKALFIVYEAKKNAENAPGVGKESDFWIIEEEKIFKIKDETILELEEIYKKKKLVLDESNNKVEENIKNLVIKKNDE